MQAIGMFFYAALEAVGIVGGTAIAIGYAVQAVILNVALSFVSRAISGSGENRSGSVDNLPLNVTVRGTTVARRIVLGRRRVAGALVFVGASSSNQSTNDYLWYVVVLAGHQVKDIKDLWFDERKFPVADWNPTTGVLADGYGKLYAWKHLGTSTQAADQKLMDAFPEWTAAHRLAGCAYLVVRFQKDQYAYPSGPPQDVSALVEGALMYDPRKDSTSGGSGSHRKTDPSTWEFSNNPALAARWFITGGSIVNDITTRTVVYGLGDSDVQVDDSYTVAAANVCDEVLTGQYASPGTTTDWSRYRCNLEASTDQPNRTTFQDIIDSMAGTAVIQKGKWQLYAGAYIAPTHTLTEADLYGDLQVQDTDSASDRYNSVSAVFVSEADSYTQRTTVPREDTGYQTQDGGQRIPVQLDLRAVTDPYQAQRLCEIKLRQSRMQRKLVLPGACNLLDIGLHEGILFSHSRYSWTSRVFRCTDRQFEFDQDAGRVSITARRDDSGVWADMLYADYAAGTSTTDVYQSDGPPTPANFNVNGRYNAIAFNWDIPSGVRDISIQLFEYTSASPFSSATLIWEGIADSVTIPKTDVLPRYYWIRTCSINGAVSGTNPSNLGTVGRAVPKWQAESALTTKAWTVGATGSQGSYVDNYDGVNMDSSIVLAGTLGTPYGPRGQTQLLWCTVGEGAAANGGWNNKDDIHGIDPTKTYRSSIWVSWNGVGNPSIFHGCSSANTLDLNGNRNSNPYFNNFTSSGRLVAGRWYLMVGFIHGSSYDNVSGGNLGGVYDSVTGVRILPATEFKIAPQSEYQEQRVYQYYTNNQGCKVYFADPQFWELSGNEPHLLTLLGLAGTLTIGQDSVTEGIYTATVAGINVTSTSNLNGVRIATVVIPAQQDVVDLVVTVSGFMVQNGAAGHVITMSRLGVTQVDMTQIPSDDSCLIIDSTSTGQEVVRTAFSKTFSLSTPPLNLPSYVYVNALGWFPGGGGTTVISGLNVRVEVLKR